MNKLDIYRQMIFFQRPKILLEELHIKQSEISDPRNILCQKNCLYLKAKMTLILMLEADHLTILFKK